VGMLFLMAWGNPPPPPPNLTYLSRQVEEARRRVPLSPPSTPTPIVQSFGSAENLVLASRWRSRVEKLILDSDGDRFLLLKIFDRTPVSRDIDS
jgi:hypothetical protein